jgi:D-alanyl-D-alanine dipeptidase
MRHENRGNFPFHTFLFVITFSHLACSQAFKPVQRAAKPLVIDNVGDYKNSIKSDTNKQIVLLQQFVPQLFTDLKYATKDNFTHHILYKKNVAFGRLGMANALKKVNEDLRQLGVGLKVFDAYRPYAVTKEMWKLVHDERYTANPANGSYHNRGTAIDVSLVNLQTGEELPMPTPFDNFSEKAHHSFMNLPADATKNRTLLRKTMEKHGFIALETEWWHYSLSNAKQYELLDLSFEQLEKVITSK